MKPSNQFKGEVRSTLKRWELESDMSDDMIAILAMEAVDEYLETKGKEVEFEADDAFTEEINEDEPEERGNDI